MFALPPPRATLAEILEDFHYVHGGWVRDCDVAPQYPQVGLPSHRLRLGERRFPRLSDEAYDG